MRPLSRWTKPEAREGAEGTGGSGPSRPGQPSDAESDEVPLKPSAMRGNEAMYGYVVLLELVIVAVLNLTVTHGAGAPKQSQAVISGLGLAAAAAFAAVLQLRNRMITGFAAIIGAFVVTLPKVPTRLQSYHIFALAIPLVYALVLAQRQRKASMAQLRTGKPAQTSPSQRRPAREARAPRRASRTVTPTGPQASGRYTPPKVKRPRR